MSIRYLLRKDRLPAVDERLDPLRVGDASGRASFANLRADGAPISASGAVRAQDEVRAELGSDEPGKVEEEEDPLGLGHH